MFSDSVSFLGSFPILFFFPSNVRKSAKNSFWCFPGGISYVSTYSHQLLDCRMRRPWTSKIWLIYLENLNCPCIFVPSTHRPLFLRIVPSLHLSKVHYRDEFYGLPWVLDGCHLICNLQNLLLGRFLLYKVAILRTLFACRHGLSKSRPYGA